MTMYERRFRLQMTVRERDLQTIFELLKDVAQDFKMIEIGAEPPRPVLANGTALPTAYQKHRKETGSRWAQKLWVELEPVFKHEKEKGDGLIRYDDQRIKDVLIRSGNSPHTSTPLLSELKALGVLERPHRGWYKIKEAA